ncbi:hypothetical protein XENOCAPTIV_009133 [Xenoophorus captivus]|uniref:DNA-directed primase/polymerase protein n=1 Tax=Xenoophorus captivus TaxID=1517983 RepID=A0ABV0QZD4_9TELE
MSRWGERLKKVEQLAQSFQQNPLMTPYKPRLVYPQSLMHCYEVIPEEAVCKLYFDLEFHKPSNKGSDGKSMVARLIQVGNICMLTFTTKHPSLVICLFRTYFLNFRLYKSSKVGKNTAFTVAQDNQFAAKPAKGMSVEESVFLASLVCNIRIVVDLKEEVWYQKCHDPDCRNFRSSSML